MMENYPDREKRICVIDDGILTGKTMDALRNYFDRLERRPARVEFACHVCNDSLTRIKQLAPMYHDATSAENVWMPWGEAFAFENCFEVPHGPSSGGSDGL
jgi:hypoxanthine phosphoribosyltransferase